MNTSRPLFAHYSSLFLALGLPLALTLALAIAFPSRAIARTDDEKSLLAFIESSAEQTAPRAIEAMKIAVKILEAKAQTGLLKMSTQKTHATFFSCALAKGGGGLRGDAGGCIDGNGRSFFLANGGMGVTVGVGSVYLIGFFRSTDDSPIGRYREFHVSPPIEVPILGTPVLLGGEALFAKGLDDDDKSVALVGPTVGWMLDVFGSGELVIKSTR